MRRRGHRAPPQQGLHLLSPSVASALRGLARDGFEVLGTIRLGTTVVVGDPTELIAPPGVGRWHGTAVRPGTWHALARPDETGELLTEVVLAHEEALEKFYDLYDDATEVAAFLLPTHRVLVVDGASRTDAELLRSAAEPDELPWLLDHGLVAAAVELHPAHVWQPRGADVTLLAVALDRAPTHRVSTAPHTQDRDDDS